MRAISVMLVLIVITVGNGLAQRGSEPRSISPEIRGQVRVPQGYSAEVGLRVQLDSMSSGLHSETMTDSSGKFHFSGLSPDSYVVRVNGPGFEGHSEIIRLEQTRLAFVTIELVSTKAPGPAQPAAGEVSAADASIPKKAREELQKGEELLKAKNDPKGSLKHFRKSAEVYPSHPRTHLMMGLAHMEMNEWEPAREELQKAIELDDKLAEAQLALGSTLNAQGKFADAEKPLRLGLQLAPGSAIGHYELGRALWALGRVDEAKSETEQVLKLQPGFAEAHLLMGNVMLRQGNADGAAMAYKEYLRLDPSGRFAEPTRAMLSKIEHAKAQGPEQTGVPNAVQK